MSDQPLVTGDLPVGDPTPRRRRELTEEKSLPPLPDPLGKALAQWAGKYDPADIISALSRELAARGIETLDQLLSTNINVILAALNAALRRDVVSLVNVVAQAKQKQE